MSPLVVALHAGVELGHRLVCRTGLDIPDVCHVMTALRALGLNLFCVFHLSCSSHHFLQFLLLDGNESLLFVVDEIDVGACLAVESKIVSDMLLLLDQ